MGNIDLVTIIHPEDKKDPKSKYTFKAPVNSGIEKDDYVIVDTKGKESLGKVISVLENVDEDSHLMEFIRTVSTIQNRKLKPISYKLEKIALNFSDNDIDRDDTDKEPCQKLSTDDIEIGTIYYSIEEAICLDPTIKSKLYVAQYIYRNCEADAKRIEVGNIFPDKDTAQRIAEIIMNISDRSEWIDVKEALKKVL